MRFRLWLRLSWLPLSLGFACGDANRGNHGGSTIGTAHPDEPDETDEPVDEAISDRPLELRVLLFTRTAGSRHESIADAQRFFRELDAGAGLTVVATEDPATFTDPGLSTFDVVAFVNTTGDVLDDAQQGALERFIAGGRGFVGVHAAADTEHDWPYFGELVGAYFVSHPRVPLEATLRLDSPEAMPSHQSLVHLEPSFRVIDEWYNFDRNPRGDATILLTVDEADFTEPNVPEGPSMGADHPVAWTKAFGGGRSFYTNLGHRPETWTDPRFVTHLLEGIRWAAGGGHYARATLTRELGNPLALAVRPDGGVYVIERTGEVRLWQASSGRVIDALVVEVDTGYENGLLGIALDPAFTANGSIYLYVSRPRLQETDVAGPPGDNAVVRYTARADGTLDPASATILLEVPSERRCCHEGGSLAFAHDGTLLISTGDNTNPFESSGAAPLDGRPGRETFDSRRTAQNPNDLRGKILRIRPDGSIPPGNLFPADGSQGRPEIFAMGVRNPFRLASDPDRFRVFWGDVGPDAEQDSVRGPRGYDEINLATVPGNFGWPYCIGFGLGYAERDFATGTIGQPFDCVDYRAPLIAYDYTTPSYPALGTGYLADGTFVGRTAIAGVVVPGGVRTFALPPRHRGQLLMTEWTRDLIGLVAVDDAGALIDVGRLFGASTFHRPIDLDIGPDGALYILEYGSEFWGDNGDARLRRIEYGEPGSFAPVAYIEASTTQGIAPLDVEFSAEGSGVPIGQSIVDYAWSIDANVVDDEHGPRLAQRLTTHGKHTVGLVVTSNLDRRSQPVTLDLIVGNAPPTVRILSPGRGTVLEAGTAMVLQGEGFDPEDGVAPCDELIWDIRLIHNTHAHPQSELRGCSVEFIPDSAGHAEQDLLSFAIELRYTDHGGTDGEPLTARQGLQFELHR